MRPTFLRLFFLSLVAIAITASAGCANEVGLTEAEIVGGTPGGDPAVLWIYNSASGGLCSSTLIDPRVVLTAKHCVQEAGASGPVRASQIIVGTGDRAGSGRTFTVQTIYTTPGSYTDRGLGGLVGRDIAVLVLTSGPSDITPIPVRRSSPNDLNGDTITATGFGQIPSGGAGRKYTAMGRVTGVDDDLIYVGSLTCQGDSGGPMITADNEVAGVVSFGNGSCGSGYGAYNAVINYFDLIDAAIEEGGGCPGDEEVETLCDGRDNDCDDMVDEPCVPIGEPCSTDALCVGNMCRPVTLPDGTVEQICTRECDARRPDLGCGDGFYCGRTAPGSCDGLCVPVPSVGTLPNDAPCATASECASLHCADPGDGMRRCLTPCQMGAGSCLAGEVCVALEGACGGCVPEEIVSGLAHGLGEPCRSSADCAGGAECYDDDGSVYCTQACADGGDACPSGYHCREMRCVRGVLGGIGESCVNNEDCGPNTICAMAGGRSWCTALCSEAAPCPDRFACVAAGGAMVCAPPAEGGLIGDPCDASDDCISGVCSSTLVCVRACGVDSPCGPGFECRRTADDAGAVCVRPEPPASGGCAAFGSRGGARSAGPLLAALSILGALLVRRSRRG